MRHLLLGLGAGDAGRRMPSVRRRLEDQPRAAAQRVPDLEVSGVDGLAHGGVLDAFEFGKLGHRVGGVILAVVLFSFVGHKKSLCENKIKSRQGG